MGNSNHLFQPGEVVAGASQALFDQVFQARLQQDNTTQISLQAYRGKYVGVNGQLVSVASPGLTLSNVANLITSAGADAAAAPAVNTLYYAYVSNALASFAPGGIRLSATAPSSVGGVKYLNTSGNGLNWRHVGWVYTISNGGTVNFVDSITQRYTVNYYNRIWVDLFAAPEWTDVDSVASKSFPAVWGKLNAGVNDGIAWCGNGEDTVQVKGIICSESQVANQGVGGISIDAGNPGQIMLSSGNALLDESAPIYAGSSNAVGRRTADLWGRIYAGTPTWLYREIRAELAVTPKVTFIYALIPI